MVFVPADGENYQTANSLVSTEYADDYHTLRGNASWSGKTEPEKQAALVKATDFVEQTYAGRFIGIITNELQLLSWPRSYAKGFENNVIPTPLKMAVCDLALEALTGNLSAPIANTAAIKRRKIDVLETEYFEAPNRPIIRPAINGALASLLKYSGNQRKVVRV